MYTQFFSLKQSPFSIAPDPRYLYMSERHREALAHLLYGVGSGGGFVLLTGEIGAGKTTVCRCFMEQIPADCRLAYIFNPKLTVEELLLSICDEFRIALPPQEAGAVSVKAYVDAINRYLLESHAAGKNNVLIIDEAQNLSAEVLEQLRLLTNLETSERKLLQIILIGQPELRAMLARPELEQLAQRVIARYHLGSLSADETGSYIAHRLAVAGAVGVTPFPRGLIAQVHQLAKGVPRRINLLCDRALLGAYVENTQQVTRTILRRAADEVFAGEAGPARLPRQWPAIAAGVLAGALISGAAAWQLLPRPTATPVAAASPAGPVRLKSVTEPDKQSGSVPDLARAGALPVLASAESAVRELAGLWGQALSDGGCAAAAKANLHCLRGKGGLDELRLLDRPAVLKLNDDPVTPRYALLTSLDRRGATLSAGGQQLVLSAQALETRFDGEFITLWRAPRTWRDAVSPGDRGPDVDWLAKRMAQLRGAPKPAEGQPLDAALLRDFQAGQNLKADGVAGPKTFIRLNQLGGVNEPRLLVPAGAAAVVAGK